MSNLVRYDAEGVVCRLEDGIRLTVPREAAQHLGAATNTPLELDLAVDDQGTPVLVVRRFLPAESDWLRGAPLRIVQKMARRYPNLSIRVTDAMGYSLFPELEEPNETVTGMNTELMCSPALTRQSKIVFEQGGEREYYAAPIRCRGRYAGMVYGFGALEDIQSARQNIETLADDLAVFHECYDREAAENRQESY